MEAQFQLQDAPVTKRTEHNHQSDEQQESLREALKLAKGYFSDKRIFRMSLKPGDARFLDEKAYDNFRKAVSKFLNQSGDHKRGLPKEYFDLVAPFWLNSPILRYFRYLKTRSASYLDRITDVLSRGVRTQPLDVDVEGLYFMYYGSYVEPEHYSIRTIEIKADIDGVLNVTDSINDRLHAGVSMEPLDIRDGKVYGISGVFLTRTKTGVASRYFRMNRVVNGDSEQMIAVSRAYSFEEICRDDMTRHREAFDDLKKFLPKTMRDPMMDYKSS